MRTLMCLLFCLSACHLPAQTRGGLDSLYGVTVPYTKEIQVIGSVGAVEVSIIRITPDKGDAVKFGRIVTSSALTTSYGLVRSVNQSSTLISREDLDYLHGQLNEYFVLANSTTPQVYTEKVDRIRGALVNLKISLFHSGGRGGWVLQLDAGRYTNRNRAQIEVDKIPDLAKLLKQAAGQL